ncbi:hypothetical protein SLNWT_3903 [Streptomyces albus]|uniref:Uncharacterized protein n=1 Tax=Streptomyces albus (strain ATCC 21838 / DSM 41398 / FERM P-419 / JCM 4703 / NBRC 107858) TaxID=1081613 RepID=A0A0B5ERM2_STRA4|nr:hypothetical protein SLNWT_3903 [Streptomyces albus]AOU78587.1 hypothetical protein SLNHY_3896 [Streptomyces albus]AYN34327.1 hypothetical protein DUI70_3828 [Streptomyces albus]
MRTSGHAHVSRPDTFPPPLVQRHCQPRTGKTPVSRRKALAPCRPIEAADETRCPEKYSVTPVTAEELPHPCRPLAENPAGYIADIPPTGR